MNWALVVHPHPEMLTSLVGAVQAELPGVACHGAPHTQRADEIAAEWGIRACRLIVCSITAPPDGDHAPSLDGRDLTGVRYVQQLRDRFGDDPPVVFIASFNDNERKAEIERIARAKLMGVSDLFRMLPRYIQNDVLRRNDPTVTHVDVDIVLRSGQQCTWSMRGSNTDPIEDNGVMDIKPEDLRNLIDLSELSAGGAVKAVRRVGTDVYKLLMQDNVRSGGLETKLHLNVGPLGGLEFARIRFNVDEKTHQILLETLATPAARPALAEGEEEADPEFWMLRTPIFRKMGSKGSRRPLFQDPATRTKHVRCLLLQGDVRRFSAGGDFNRSFDAIEHARAEIDWLKQYLEESQQEFGVEQVDVLRYGEHTGEFRDAVHAALTTGNYNLVHYAGHSAVDAQKKAHLVFGNRPGDLVDLDLFSSWARQLEFVFLSSCQSASSQFVIQVVRKDIPAVIGYAWPVQDEVASEFASAFYRNLFGQGRRHPLEYAFMEAKKALHRAWPDRAHWAAPLLFMQMLDACTGEEG